MASFLAYEEILNICQKLNDQFLPSDDSFYEKVADIYDQHLENSEPKEVLMKAFFELLMLMDKEIHRLEKKVKITPTCAMGCAHCCYFPIIVNKMEVKLLWQHIQALDSERKAHITDHLTRYYALNKEKISDACQADFQDDPHFKQTYIEKQLSCPFLDTNTNSCLVYEVRPTPCRTYLNYASPAVCTESFIPKEPFSYHFLEEYYMAALHELTQTFMYQGEGEHLGFTYPDDALTYDYLPRLLEKEF